MAFLSSVVFSSDLADPGQEKLKLMQKLLDKSRDGVISLDADQYINLILENPRPYDVVTMFTVKTGCT
jgi:hypothetical protein